MSLPTVYACAPTARADSAASPPVCTRTLPKSWPKRDSMKPRVGASSGCPGALSTLLTIGGMFDGAGEGVAALRWIFFFASSSAHLPPHPDGDEEPHEHLRMSDGTRAGVTFTGVAVFSAAAAVF